jgi:UDP-glucose 4-epimerase
MRVAVTGASGNLGTSLVQVLSQDPDVESILGLVRRPPAWTPARTTWRRADVVTAPLEELLAGVDAVVHLAWAFQPTHDPAVTWRNNVRGSERVFAAAAAVGAGALVHASSIGTYRARDGLDPVDESWPTDALPTAAYGREKSYLERRLDIVERDHPAMRVVRMRPAFLFRQRAASAQRRIFGGPLVPTSMLRLPLPLVPLPAGLWMQVLHTSDAAEAIRAALHRPVRGAFNLAAEPVLGAADLAELLGGRPVELSRAVCRSALAAAWHLHLVPASPQLLDLFLDLPLLDTTRAREELDWSPEVDGRAAFDELLEGLRRRRSFPTPPLAPDRPGRVDEFRTGVGGRER